MLKVTESEIAGELDRYMHRALTQSIVVEKPDREPVVMLSLAELNGCRKSTTSTGRPAPVAPTRKATSTTTTKPGSGWPPRCGKSGWPAQSKRTDAVTLSFFGPHADGRHSRARGYP